MNNEDLLKDAYAIKGVKNVKFDYQKGKLSLDTAIETECLNIDGSNVVIVSFEVTDDKTLNYLDNFKNGNIEILLEGKKYWDGEWITKSKSFSDLSIIRRFVSYSYEEPTTWKYIFADCDYCEIKKELTAYLLPNCKNDLTETLKQEQTLLLDKIKECRENGEFNTYKNLINALREVTYLVNQEETRLLNKIN